MEIVSPRVLFKVPGFSKIQLGLHCIPRSSVTVPGYCRVLVWGWLWLFPEEGISWFIWLLGSWTRHWHHSGWRSGHQHRQSEALEVAQPGKGWLWGHLMVATSLRRRSWDLPGERRDGNQVLGPERRKDAPVRTPNPVHGAGLPKAAWIKVCTLQRPLDPNYPGMSI